MNESQTIVIDGKSGITQKILSFVELLKLNEPIPALADQNMKLSPHLDHIAGLTILKQ